MKKEWYTMRMRRTVFAGLLTAALAALPAGPASAQGFDFSRLLKQTMPEADRFSQLAQTVGYKAQSLTQAIFPAYRGSEQIGVLFYAAPPGYSGRLHTLTAMDMEGTVRMVNVFSHTETPAYVAALNNGSFQRQFEGVSLLHKLALLIGRRAEQKGDIVAISGATDTSKPIAVAVSEARKLFVEIYRN